MSLGTLKFFRTLIPGIMIFLLAMLFFTNDLNELKNISRIFTDFKAKDTLFIVLFVVLGILYYIFKIRNILWGPFYKRIVNNIKDRLLDPFRGNLNSTQITELKRNRKLMNIFYHFIDNDPSLQEKAKRVRFNGLIWSSTIDLTIISFLGSLIFLIKFIFIKTNYNINVALILFCISVFSLVLIFLTTNKHLSLSNDQLGVICQLYKNQLNQKINELL